MQEGTVFLFSFLMVDLVAELDASSATLQLATHQLHYTIVFEQVLPDTRPEL